MSLAGISRPTVWDFLSSRDYVVAYDAWAATNLRGYSRRAFAKWARYSSPNALTLVISGRRRLSRVWLPGFGRAAKLTSHEMGYLNLLLAWEGSRDRAESERRLAELEKYVVTHRTASVAGDTLNLVRNPLAWTIYHMVDLKDQIPSAKWFKARLIQKAAVPLIQRALESLERTGLIAKPEGAGRYRARETFLESPDQMKPAQNSEFHRYVLNEALGVLDSLDPSQRSFGSLTVALKREREEEFKAEVGRFGRYLQKKYGTAAPVDGDLFRMNLQLYPLTHKENSDEK